MKSSRRGHEEDHSNSAGPSDLEALNALRVLRAWFGVPSTPAVYTQWDLPPGAKSADAYKRRHRALRRAGVGGVRVVGKTLECTLEGWATDLEKPRPPKAKPKLVVVPSPEPDLVAEVAHELGLVPVRSR